MYFAFKVVEALLVNFRCVTLKTTEMNFQFEDISKISVDGWKVCSLTLWVFIGDFNLGKMEMRLFLLEPLYDGFADSSEFIFWLEKVGAWFVMRALTILILRGTVRKLSLSTY